MSGSPLGATRSPPPQQGDLLMAAKAKNQAGDANEDGNINYEEFSNVVMEAAN